MTTHARIRRQHSQRHLNRIRTPRELVGEKPWDASSNTPLDFITYERRIIGAAVSDNDGDDDSQTGGLAIKPASLGQGHRNAHNPNDISNTPGGPISKPGSGASNTINRTNGPPNQDQDTGRGSAPPQITQGVAFVTLTSTQTKTTFVSITDAAASTVTATLTLTVGDVSDAGGRTRNSFPTNSTAAPTTTTADSINSNSGSDGRAPLSGGSIAAIVIGMIIFVALIMAFVIRMMSFRKERRWTEIDRGIPRFRDEEEPFEYRQKLLPDSRPADLPFLAVIEPKLPPRALRKPTIRFVTPPAQSSTIDDLNDSGSQALLTADTFPKDFSFLPSTNNPPHGTMPRAGILLNPLVPTVSNS